MSGYSWLALAIVFEVAATLALKSAGKSSAILIGVVAAYGLAFLLLSRSLVVLPVGVAYAVWAGVGTALVAIGGWAIYGEAIGIRIGLGLICVVLGVVLLSGAEAPVAGGL